MQYQLERFGWSYDTEDFEYQNEYEEQEEELDDEPSPLEDISQKQQEWMVYDPIVGVVPHSMKELWQQQEQDRNELYEQLCYTQRIQSLPPVRYSVEYENNARDKATSSSQEITPPNTLS